MEKQFSNFEQDNVSFVKQYVEVLAVSVSILSVHVYPAGGASSVV